MKVKSCLWLLSLATFSLWLTPKGIAQESDPFAPAKPLAGGWEKMDERLVFLMVRLADVEANLEAVDQAIQKNQLKAGAARGNANRAEGNNDRMDRNAGGPVRWDQFYGRTAEKFFYHPTENHTYHTETILTQQSTSNDNQTGAGVPSRQGVPVHQRPPQFDYIYRANENAKARALTEVDKIANKVDALAARRLELENEQSKLWCEVAFRAVSRNDLDKKPLYRYMPVRSNQEALSAAAEFVVVSLSIVSGAEKDQASTFRQVKPLLAKARDDLATRWLQTGKNYRDESTNEWKFGMIARHLQDVSSNLADSYSASVTSAQNSDSARRDMYRGLLQKSLVQYAEAVLALNEMATEMATAYNFEPDLQRPITLTSILQVDSSTALSEATSADQPSTSKRNGSMADLLGSGGTAFSGNASPDSVHASIKPQPELSNNAIPLNGANEQENLLLSRMRSGNLSGQGWRLDRKGLYFDYSQLQKNVSFSVPQYNAYSLSMDLVGDEHSSRD